MRIAYLTAGAAGMFCGSCMHDNSLAREFVRRGHECLLLPVYTPIRTDEQDVSSHQVFFGGINVYLQQKWPRLARLPRPILQLLDQPWLLRLATKRAGGTRAELLGDMTVSMLEGSHGHHAKEVKRLVDWLKNDFHADVVILSNLLIGGCIPELREQLGAKVFVWLQGDDIFLDHLPESYRQQATTLMGELAVQTQGLFVNSQFYANKMADRFAISTDLFETIPLAIQLEPFQAAAAASKAESVSSRDTTLRLGYLARLAPEKGFHHLVDAFIELSQRIGKGRVQLHYAGWLGDQHRAFFAEQQRKLERAGLREHHQHHGSPDFDAKVQFLRSLDLFCVPTVYEECKGLYVLEALAAGVPVVQPEHGAFPELIASSGGGKLWTANDTQALVKTLEHLVHEPSERAALMQGCAANLAERHSIDQQAEKILQLIDRC